MTCSRCHGLMHREWIARGRHDAPLTLMACYICGDRTDTVILLNRRIHHELFRASRQWAEQQLFRTVG